MHHHAQDAVTSAGPGWIVPALVLLLIAVAIAAAWLLATRERDSGELAASGQKAPPNLDGQIMAMLHQMGRPVTQIEISLALDVPTATLASAMERLESSGWVRRTWDPAGYTYSVALTDSDAGVESAS